MLVYIVMMIVVPLPPPGWIPGPRHGPGAGLQPGPGWQPGPGRLGRRPRDACPARPAGHGPHPPAGWGAPPPGGWPQPAWSGPRPGNAGIVAGVILIALGVWFLVDRYVHIDWDLLWPVVVMIIGGGLIAGALMRRQSP